MVKSQNSKKILLPLLLVLLSFCALTAQVPRPALASGQSFTYPSSETIYLGGTSGISGAQAEDGTYENIYETVSHPSHYAESLNESTTTSTTYQDKVTLTFTPEPNSTYLIIGTWLMQMSSTSYQVKAKLARTTGTAKDFNELIYQPKDATDYLSGSAIGIDAFGDSPGPQTYKIQFCSSNTAGTARIKEARIFAMKLDSLDAYAQSEARSTTTSTSWQDKATLTFTPPTQENYLILAYATADGSSTSYDFKVQLTIGGTAYDTTNIEPYNSANRYPWAVAKVVNLPASSQTIKIQYCSESTLATAGIAHARIVALNLRKFQSLHYAEAEARTTTTSTTFVDKLSLSPTLTDGDYLVIGTAGTDGASTSYSSVVQAIRDDSTYGAMSIEPQDTTTRHFSYFTIKRESLTAGTHTWKIQHRTTNSSGASGIQDARLAVLRLPGFRLDVQHDITNIPEGDNYLLEMKYYTAGDTEPVSLYLYNFSSGTWDNLGNLEVGGSPGSPYSFSHDLTGTDYLSGGEVRVRYVQYDNDYTQTSMMVDFLRVRSEVIPKEWRLLEEWTEEVSSVAGWATTESWAAAGIAGAAWSPLEQRSCHIYPAVGWSLLERWESVVEVPTAAPEWRMLERWEGEVEAEAGWGILDSWISTLPAPVGWRFLDQWLFQVFSRVDWWMLEAWTVTLRSEVGWAEMEAWGATIVGAARWQVSESWQAITFTVVAWQLADAWATEITTSATWRVAEGWGVSLATKASWVWLEEGFISTYGSAEWKPVDTVCSAASSAAEWTASELWISSLSGRAGWLSLDLWVWETTAPALWWLAEPWEAKTHTTTQWVTTELWTGTAVAGANWTTTESWTVAAEAPVLWRILDSTSEVLSTTAGWSQTEVWLAKADTLAGWLPIESLTETLKTLAEWTTAEGWTGVVCAHMRWWSIDSWGWTTGTQAWWRATEAVSTGTRAPASWKKAETVTGTATSPPPPENEPPPVPSLVSPPDRFITADNTPTFDWEDVYDPSGVTYVLEIVGVLQKETAESQYTLEEAEALPDGTYCWRVMAVDGYGNRSNWSESRSITILTSAVVYTRPATEIGTTAAVLNSEIWYGVYESVDISFELRPKGTTSWLSTPWQENFTNNTYSFLYVGLSPSSTYQFRARIRYGPGLENYGSILEFTTKSIYIPIPFPTPVPVMYDVKADALPEKVEKGGQVTFVINIARITGLDVVDITVSYTVTGQDNRVYASKAWTETFVAKIIEERISTKGWPAGKYTVSVIVTWPTGSAESSDTFEVVREVKARNLTPWIVLSAIAVAAMLLYLRNGNHIRLSSVFR